MGAIFIDCTAELDRAIKRHGLSVPGDIRINVGSPTEDEVVALLSGAAVAFTEHTPITPAILDRCPDLDAIVFMGTGAGTYIDLADAARRHVRVLTTPGYGDHAVAEHAFALMIAAARNIAGMDRAIRAGRWHPMGGLQLQGLKVAVIGLGGIGLAFAEMASAFGMRVAAWNRTPRAHPAFVSDLDQALLGAEVVSLHLGLNEETEGLIDARRLELPKPGYILVNTARAALVDEAAMLATLSCGRIGHASLDVFPTEPLPPNSPYLGLENVTLTAHAAYMTDAAYEELWRRTLKAYGSLQS